MLPHEAGQRLPGADLEQNSFGIVEQPGRALGEAHRLAQLPRPEATDRSPGCP